MRCVVCGDDRSSRHGTRDAEVHTRRKPGCPFTQQLGTASRSLAGRRSLSLRPTSTCATAGPCAPAIRAHDHCQQFNVQRSTLVTGRWLGLACVAVHAYAYSYAGQADSHTDTGSCCQCKCQCQCLYATLTLPRICSRVSSLAFGRVPGPGQQDSRTAARHLRASRVVWPWDLQLSVSRVSAHLLIYPATQPPSQLVSLSGSSYGILRHPRGSDAGYWSLRVRRVGREGCFGSEVRRFPRRSRFEKCGVS